MRSLHLIFALAMLFLSGLAFAQSKKDLQDQIDRQQKSMDSLNKVIENWENIVESRDRTIRFLREDTAKLNDDMAVLYGKIRQKNLEIAELRKQVSTGEAKMITMTNSRATLKVPEGKYWIINQFITDYISEMHPDSLGIYQGEEIHIFLVALNGETLTDTTKNRYGPQLYSSMHPENQIGFPIILTENTSFKIMILQGRIGALKPYSGRAYCTLTEKET